MVEEKEMEQVAEHDPSMAETGTGQAKTENPSAEERVLTQSQVNALMGKIRKEAKISLLKELGFDDVDALRDALSKLREQEEAQKTEAQKLAEKLSQLQSENARLAQERVQTLLRMEVTNCAARLGFIDPGDAYQMIDLAELQVADDGSVKGVEAALQQLAKSKPYLLKAQPQMGPTNMPRSSGVDEADTDRRARLFGGVNSVLGKAGGGVFWPKKD